MCAAEFAMQNDGGFVERGNCIDGEAQHIAVLCAYFDQIGFWAHPGTCHGREFQLIEEAQDHAYLKGKVTSLSIMLNESGIRDFLTIAARAVAMLGEVADVAA
jgi:hypothetical protein